MRDGQTLLVFFQAADAVVMEQNAMNVKYNRCFSNHNSEYR